MCDIIQPRHHQPQGCGWEGGCGLRLAPSDIAAIVGLLPGQGSEQVLAVGGSLGSLNGDRTG